mmetsp:Transcript_13526/g.19798  ORF Transcript_13526/g.19798 Transcript_13526/m.19798 type:complete len:478 (+) Transcript_13526:52-1485(+)
MFSNLLNGINDICGISSNDKVNKEVEPFTFDANDVYKYPTLFEEADEMLQVSLLIYTFTDLRFLAKKAKDGTLKGGEFKDPDLILSLPLNLSTCVGLIEENVDVIKQEVGDADHEMTIKALESIQKRYNNNSPMMKAPLQWFKSDPSLPYLVAYGDDNPDKELVYAVGVDPVRKRVTVAFRGSVTPSDFLTDATISLERQPNPVKDLSVDQSDKIGIHKGFFNYLLKPRKEYGGESKCAEIFQHVIKLFEDEDRKKNYKLYVTGHSLGGALSTLFGFYAASSARMEGTIPLPISVVSVASPRVGDAAFQEAFYHLEHQGCLRHLRVANKGDPVTIMPESSGIKVFALMSPITYAALKFSDSKFEEKETYRHTGIKLLLSKKDQAEGDRTEQQQQENGDIQQYRISYSCKKYIKEEVNSKKKTTGFNILKSFSKKDIPEVVNHFGDTYYNNLTSVKDSLSEVTLNDLYLSHASSVFSK